MLCTRKLQTDHRVEPQPLPKALAYQLLNSSLLRVRLSSSQILTMNWGRPNLAEYLVILNIAIWMLPVKMTGRESLRSYLVADSTSAPESPLA